MCCKSKLLLSFFLLFFFSTTQKLQARSQAAEAAVNRHKKRVAEDKKQAEFQKEENRVRDYKSLQFLKQQLQDLKAYQKELEKIIENSNDEELVDAADDNLGILEYLEEQINEVIASEASNDLIYSTNIEVERLLEGLKNPAEGQFLPETGVLLKRTIGGMLFGHTIPNVSKGTLNKKISLAQARKESITLHNARAADFYDRSQLTAFSPKELSELDISPLHPAWYDEKSFAKIRGGLLNRYYQKLNAGVTHELQDEEDLNADENYDINTYRKVLIFKNVYQSATSAKAKTEDALGVDYKIKWGDETAVEPVASRLYLLTGAKITDANFAVGPGANNLVLILNEKGSHEKSTDEECFAENYEQLAQCLRDYYNFDLSPYYLASGLIESEDDPILKKLPKVTKKKYKAEKLVGRRWVTFKETMLELNPKGYFERLATSKMSNFSANKDRVARASYLFNLWISNRDVKDDNNKAYLVKGLNSDGQWDIQGLYEAHHDLGLSLGNLFSAGYVNKLATGRKFARKSFNKIRFPVALIFKPEAWMETTFSDARWMARKITGLTVEEINEAVRASQWPDFAQAALSYKLLARRDRIAEMFYLENETPSFPSKAPSLSVPLRTDREVYAAANRYGIPANLIFDELDRTGLRNNNFVDSLLIDGQINQCQKTILIGLIVDTRHPSGLDLRPGRKEIPFTPKNGDQRCRYGIKNL